jgi:hypothetical protein
MSSCELMHVIPLSICRLVAVKSRTIPRSNTSLGKPNRIAGEIGRSGGAAASSQRTDHEWYEKKG